MSIERERLRTEIASRKFRLGEVAQAMDTKMKDLRAALAGYPLIKPDQVRASHIAETSAELEALQREYLALKAEIEAGEKELNG